MAKSQEIYKWVLIFIMSVCINDVIGRPKRSVSPSPVMQYCAEAEASRTPNISYTDAIANLVTVVNGVSNDAQATMTFMLDNFGDTYLVNVQNVDLHFVTMSGINSVQQKIETLKQHYRFVYEHLDYVTALVHGTGISTGDSVDGLKTELLKYQRSLSRCLCCIRVALIASGYTEQVPTDATETSAVFNVMSHNIDTEIKRAYFVIGDGLILLSHLNEAYNDF